MCSPRRDIMRLHSKATLPVVLFLLLYVLLSTSAPAQSQSNGSQTNGQQSNAQPINVQPGNDQESKGQQAQAVQPTPLPSDVDPADPALPVWLRPATASTSAGKTAAAANAQPAVNEDIVPSTGHVGEVTKGEHGFGMRVKVENVTLPVTVVDDKSHLVTDLNKANFTVYENGEQQEIIDFHREDIPVSIGIVVDNSGSMREKREKVSTAVLNLIKASNPGDEEFIVNFNDEAYLDQDFTNSLASLHEALDRLDSRGGTALYDAVIASCDHLAKAAKREKKVVILITDGEDNSSQESLEQAIRSVQDENGPTIYSIGILGSEGRQRRARRALEELSLQTGGVAFFPKNLDEVESISQAVARDIRNQYSITYKPSNPQANGGYRQVKVVARAPGYKELIARTKSGYFPGEQNKQNKTASSKGGE
jgi:Ca-activated chloride channel homolog